MRKKKRSFADDSWAVWIDGDDTSTVYINDWINPKGNSYLDFALRIRGIQTSRYLSVYIPFPVAREELQDLAELFHNRRILQAIFSAACIVDYKKNPHVSEIAYNGKTVDIVHLGTLPYTLQPLEDGTLLEVDLEALRPYLDNDEIYFIWRMPHKTINTLFRSAVNVGSLMERLRDLLTSPVLSEKYGYSIRVNEARLLPEQINRIGAFHRQKLKKAVITLSVNQDYEVNDSGCYRISRLEEKLYREYLPADFDCENVITYQWNQNRDYNLLGHFNFYNNIGRNSISKGSMFLYLLLVFLVGLMSDFIYSLILSALRVGG